MKLTAALLVLIALFTGCSSVRTHRNPGANLNRHTHFFVQHQLTDDRHIDETIVAALQALGKEASAGPLTMMPDATEVIVVYDAEWAWDFRSYLIQLDIEFHDARRDRSLAMGTYRQPSPLTKPPDQVVRAILTPLFK